MLFAASIYGWIAEKRVADSETEKAQIAEALTKFERKTFPYSLVVGYVRNFLSPALEIVSNKDAVNPAHIFIYMPYTYEELDINGHAQQLDEVFKGMKQFNSFSSVEIEVHNRKRGISLVKADFEGIDIPIYVDHANTVVAFQYVVDYKCDPEKNPMKIEPTIELKDEMVLQYTNEFIESTLEELKEYSQYIHFVKSNEELKVQIDKIIKKDGKN